MPKFVPVMDTEKPLSEQQGDPSSLAKHRRFDNPYSLADSTGHKKVDRGWQQGNVGWGVLGSFGSNGKDEMAQVVRKAEGAHKMVKNSKGLWVKQTDTDSITIGGGGRGRGSGIPVFNSMHGHEEKSSAKTYDQRDDYKFEDNEDDIGPRKGQQSNRNRSSSRDRSRSRDRNRDRDRGKGRDRDRDSDRARGDEYRGHRDGDRDRNRSRSRDRHRHSRDHEGSVGRKRERDQFDDSKHDRKYRERSHDRDRNRYRKRDRDRSASQDDRRGRETKEDRVPADEEAEAAEEEEASIRVTAIQVVNRFHEVYSTDTLFAQDRIASLCALLAPSSSIRSLKTDAEYLAGSAAIGESFNKTLAAPVAVSKRVYIEPSGQDLAGADSVSYVMDLHRAGTAPGLGDKAKDTVLFYRVKGAEIASIWGTADSEKLAADSDLSRDRLLGSKAWKLVSQIVAKERGSLDEAGVHYHNYDHMEVWG